MAHCAGILKMERMMGIPFGLCIISLLLLYVFFLTSQVLFSLSVTSNAIPGQLRMAGAYNICK